LTPTRANHHPITSANPPRSTPGAYALAEIRATNSGLLAVTAIDRALKQVELPEVNGRSVFVEAGLPGDVLDDLYLQRSIEVGSPTASRRSLGIFEERADVPLSQNLHTGLRDRVGPARFSQAGS
jgi:hypothetical protein